MNNNQKLRLALLGNKLSLTRKAKGFQLVPRCTLSFGKGFRTPVSRFAHLQWLNPYLAELNIAKQSNQDIYTNKTHYRKMGCYPMEIE